MSFDFTTPQLDITPAKSKPQQSKKPSNNNAPKTQPSMFDKMLESKKRPYDDKPVARQEQRRDEPPRQTNESNNKPRPQENNQDVKNDKNNNQNDNENIKNESKDIKSEKSQDSKSNNKNENTEEAKDVKNKKDVKNTKDGENKEIKKPSTSSLLDKMIMNAKQSLKDGKTSKEDKVVQTKDKKDTKNTKVTKDKNVKVIKDIKLDKITKEEGKTKTKEVVIKNIETKTKTTKKEVVIKNIETKIIKEEVVVNDVKVKKDTKIESENIKKTNKKVTVVSKKQDENISDKKEKSSLFDSIVKDLPIEDKDIKIPTKEVIQAVLSDTKIVDKKNKTNKKATKQNLNSKDKMTANMFLGTQKNNNELNKIKKINESNETLKESKTTTGVKKSADILKLNASEIEIVTTGDTKKPITIKPKEVIKSPYNLLDKLVLDKKQHKTVMSEINPMSQVQSLATESKTQQSSSIKDTIELTLSGGTIEALKGKIIGARQKVSTFMSDVARKMYLNYKPPVTAFRLNLNPANLGNIAITLRTNKADKSLSVSMNMSSSSTLEAFTDNKLALQNALQKNFAENSSNLSLNFSMQDGSSNQKFDQAKKEQDSNQDNDNKTEQATIEDEEIQENQDYM
jgi:hypothetical protein